MSKAVILHEHGGPDVLRVGDRADKNPGPGEIAVANAAVGVNFIDIYQRKGLYPVSTPAVLGGEGAGRIAELGESVDGFAEGDRVAWLGSEGYAGRSVVSAAMAAPIPDAVPDEIAAAVFLKGLTAQMLVFDVFALKAGQTALVHAAAGGVGSLLTQWAAALGATVIGVVGDARKADIAAKAGAAHVIVRGKAGSISAETRRLTGGRGVDVVYDAVGAATFEDSLDSLAMRGTMVSYGNASGPPPAIAPLDLMRRGSLTLCRPSLFHYATPERLPAMAARLFEMIASGGLKIAPPAVFDLEEAPAAHRLLESGASTGSIVLRP